MISEAKIYAAIADINNKLNELELKINANNTTLFSNAGVNSMNVSVTQDALCETSIDVDERITAIEDALCELSEEE